MASAGWALQRAVYERLTSAAEVTATLGGPNVYDDVPRGATYPYLTIGQSSTRDWSTASEDGEEHTLTLHVSGCCVRAWAGGGRGRAGEHRGRVRERRGWVRQQPSETGAQHTHTRTP